MAEKHTQFTPGPWTFGYIGSYGYCITTQGGTHLATSILYKRDGGKANARLIAAAPMLLEALQIAEWRMRSLLALIPAGVGPSPWGDLDYTDARHEAERDIASASAAIAAATGQEDAS